MSAMIASKLSCSLPCSLLATAAVGIAATSVDAANYVEIVAARTSIPGKAEPFLLDIAVSLDAPAVIGVTVTTAAGTQLDLFGDDDGFWDAQVPLAALEDLRTETDGTWTIEVFGALASTSTFVFQGSTYVDADLPALATGVSPAEGEQCVLPGVTMSWADPTGGTVDVLAVSACDPFECQDDDSVLGTLESTDTSWTPPLTLAEGPGEFEVVYANIDPSDRASALEVVAGSILWANSPYAPDGYPAQTPLVANASAVVTQFSVLTAGPSMLVWIDRVEVGGKPGINYLTGFEIDLAGVAGVTGGRVTTGGGIVLDFTGAGNEWDEDLLFATLDEATAAANGLWTIEVFGAEPSTTVFAFASSSFGPSDFFAPSTGLVPGHGESVDGDVTFQWTPPPDAALADAIAINVGLDTEPFEELYSDNSVLGTMELTDVAWTPPAPLQPGDYAWDIYYARVDSLGRVSSFKVVSGSIDWAILPCLAPPGYPVQTPLLIYGGERVVAFSVLGGGGATFDPPVDIGVITQPGAVGAADFDGINGNDIIVPVSALDPADPGLAAVFLNDGTGVSYERVDTQVGVGPSGVAVGDFDGSSGPDAAVTNAGDGTVTILLNDGLGAGTFLTSQVIPVGLAPSAIDSGDVDEDFDLDLIVVNFGDGTAVLLRNDDGTFVAEDPFVVGNGPRDVKFGSFAGAPGPGSAVDFVVANADDGEVVIFENDGAGGYAKSSSVAVGLSPTSIDPEDLDEDKDTDMAVGGCDSDFVVVLSSDGAGGFVATEVPVGDCPSHLDVADVDGDGDEDIVVVSVVPGGDPILRGATILQNLLETGRPEFVPAGAPIVAEGLEFALAAELDGDARIDLVAAGSVDGVGTVVVATNTTEVEPGDVDGDGIVDVTDLLAVLSSWGDCPEPPITCPADLDDDGAVGVGDLLQVLANWS